jgi:hypothetical protein
MQRVEKAGEAGKEFLFLTFSDLTYLEQLLHALPERSCKS